MAVKDDWFVETINSISPNVTKEIKETLSPIISLKKLKCKKL